MADTIPAGHSRCYVRQGRQHKHNGKVHLGGDLVTVPNYDVHRLVVAGIIHPVGKPYDSGDGK